eukprot:EG_transcript_10642
MQDLQQSLQKLTNLKNSNLISDEEYEARRNQLVDGYIGVPTLSKISQSPATFTGRQQHQSSPVPYGFIASSAPYTTAYFHPSMLAQGLFGLSTSDTQQELYTLNRQAHLPLGKCGSTFKQAAKSSTVKVQPLTPDITREVLVATFSIFGEVASAAVKRGVPICGYVTFASPHGAALALAQGQLSLDTTTAFITLAAQRKAAQLEAGPSNGVGLFNLPFSTTYDELQCMLKDYEGLQTIKMVHKRDTGQFKGYAFVYFDTVAHATQAKAMLVGLTMGDQRVDVKFAAQSADSTLPGAPHEQG